MTKRRPACKCHPETQPYSAGSKDRGMGVAPALATRKLPATRGPSLRPSTGSVQDDNGDADSNWELIIGPWPFREAVLKPPPPQNTAAAASPPSPPPSAP